MKIDEEKKKKKFPFLINDIKKNLGDSGGPLMNEKSGRWFLIGEIHS